MADSPGPERRVVTGLLALQIFCAGGMILFANPRLEGGLLIGDVLLAGIMLVLPLLLYLRGYDWARYVACVGFGALVGLLLPEPFVSEYAPLVLILAPLLALILATPVWVVGTAALQLLLLLLRADWQGIYTTPVALLVYWLCVASLVVARQVIDGARARAEEQARLLDAERSQLELRVAERTSELAEANAELRRANQLKDFFLASVSHELRTPLNIMLGSMELLSEEIYGPLNECQRQTLSTMTESGQHLLYLINDLLDLAKMEAGSFRIDLGEVPVRELCEQCERLVRGQMERRGLAFTLTLDPALGLIPGDFMRLRQVLLNLLSNAMKFTPSGGRVGLEARVIEEGQRVEFAVQDTGIGIDPARFGQLFQPFSQLDRRLARQYEGTGLGLALVSQIVTHHGGEVGVQSELGAGSRFWVRLPSGPLPEAPRLEWASAPEHPHQ